MRMLQTTRPFSTFYTNAIVCFPFDPLSRAFSNRCVFDKNAQRISVDETSERIEMYAFSDKIASTWTGRKTASLTFTDLHPPSSTSISLFCTFIHPNLPQLAFIYLHPPSSTSINLFCTFIHPNLPPLAFFVPSSTLIYLH